MDIITQAWHTYPALFDLLLYFLFFSAVARAALTRHFPGSDGTKVAIAVGLALAAGLTTAQRTIGFSVEKLGPAAVFLILMVVLVTAYKFLSITGVPGPITLLACAALAGVMLKATLPEYTQRALDSHPEVGLIGPIILLAILWTLAQVNASHERAAPQARALAKYGAIPNAKNLKQEEHVTKRPLRGQSKRAAKEEKRIGHEIQGALQLLQTRGLNHKTRPKIYEHCEHALKQANQLEQQQDRLLQLDRAIENLDHKWLERSTALKLRQLTPQQQQLMTKTIADERQRLHIEEELEELQAEVTSHTRAIREGLAKAKECLLTWNAPGAAGWLEQATQQQKKAKNLQTRILACENRLISLVKRQERETRGTYASAPGDHEAA